MKLISKILPLVAAMTLWGCDNNQHAAKDNEEQQYAVAKISTQLPHYLERDIRDEVFYFVMPDRFQNGDTSNDNGSKTLVESQGGFDKTSKGHYHGGDIIGLKDKLPYLQEMGITSIWMTPIMRNQAVQGDSSGYHGYWVLDFSEIDPHLGSNQDLKDLIDAAHKLNMKVFFDIIANHSADVIKFKECHGEDGKQWLGATPGLCDYKTLEQVANGDKYTVFVPEGSENIKTPQWLNDPKYYHNQGDSTWEGESAIYGDFAGLDDIDTDNPEVVAGLIDVFKGVVSEFKPDGFRIDTVKHVNMEFWSEFSPAIVDHAKSLGIPQFFMFGEVYDSTPEFLSTFTTTGKMQSILDFAVQSGIYKSLIEQKGTNELEAIFNGDHFYKDEDSDASQLVTFTGNHDMGRFAYMLDRENPDMSEAEKLARIKLSNALMYFSRGIPVVYYGDEQGFVGDGNDKDSRQDMMPSLVASYNDDDLLGTDATTADDNFDQSHVLYQDLVALANLYVKHDALRHGAQAQVYAQDTPGIYAFTRTTEHAQYLIVANTATTEQKQTFNMSYKGFEPVVLAKDKSEDNGEVTINLAPLSYAIYKAQ
ncbi:alpha-amylase family glycosyl hydrolase [Thalassomonas sp. M1454]|uniref:alpha-amylase family glycosyl hydrolase n=1 Tax=Thalassomonas sp. M1454 TaxID=2594477 RepID=UPI00117C66D6|nr:alpha-amylase family glycosyl hydrolase [Thalassomonas sp. M1454]TRX58072.1 alpha-amylase [Thalassomonas sp. M1454]